MYRRDCRTLWRQGTSAQSGAGSGRQKKTARSLVTDSTFGLIDAYEHLRAVALGAQPICGAGLSTLHRQGMAAWIRAASTPLDATLRSYRGLPAVVPIATSELTLILASLVATLATEPAHA